MSLCGLRTPPSYLGVIFVISRSALLVALLNGQDGANGTLVSRLNFKTTDGLDMSKVLSSACAFNFFSASLGGAITTFQIQKSDKLVRVDVKRFTVFVKFLVHGQVTIILVVFVCLSVSLFVQSFSQPSSIRFGSN